jgi:hypothetical protein
MISQNTLQNCVADRATRVCVKRVQSHCHIRSIAHDQYFQTGLKTFLNARPVIA